jgi:hypothetical protein
MSRWCLFALTLPFISGCLFSVRTGDTAPPESVARVPLRARLMAAIEKLLSTDRWAGTIAEKTVEGRVSPNPGDVWSEDGYTLDVAATKPDGTPVLIPVDDYLPLLLTLRRRIRDVVEESGGEQLEWTTAEAYRERSLLFRYKSGAVVGWVLVRMHPKTERPEELLTRIDVTVQERPAPEG